MPQPQTHLAEATLVLLLLGCTAQPVTRPSGEQCHLEVGESLKLMTQGFWRYDKELHCMYEVTCGRPDPTN